MQITPENLSEKAARLAKAMKASNSFFTVASTGPDEFVLVMKSGAAKCFFDLDGNSVLQLSEDLFNAFIEADMDANEDAE